MTFKSTSVEKNADGTLKITGELTIRGVTHTVVLNSTAPKAPIKDPWGLQRSAVAATTKINRQEFGVSWNQNLDAGGVVVGAEVNITLDVEMVIPPAK
jgi:polyisoprenoid-binding protein YceI